MSEIKEVKKEDIGDKKSNIICMLKYIFIDSDKLVVLQTSILNKEEGEEEKELVQTIFKKISIVFKILKKILKMLILQVDDEIYQLLKDHEIKIPQDIEELTKLIGTFHKSFTDDQIKLLFDIVDFHKYKEFISISEINYLMIPFVANGSINYNKLEIDFNKFSILIRDLACDALSLNTSFEDYSIIEQ
jgi:hypothetical protein